MVFTTTLINLLLASAALAAPSLEAKLQRRNAAAAAAGQESSTTKYLGERDGVNQNDCVDLNGNWAGALYYHNERNTFQNVSAAVTIPDFNSGSASAWVGLDGYTCHTAALHTGLNLTVGRVTPWYRLYPDDPKPFPTSLSINTGDVVRMTVSTSTDQLGFVQIQNLNSTLAVTQHTWILNPDGGLCRSEVIWFAAWGGLLSKKYPLLLTDITATTTAGVILNPEPVNTMDMS